MIADQEARWRRHLVQLRPQEAVGTWIPQVGEIAGDHDALGVRVQCFDLFEAAPQALQGIDALRPISAWLDEVEIGQPDQLLHAGALSR